MTQPDPTLTDDDFERAAAQYFEHAIHDDATDDGDEDSGDEGTETPDESSPDEGGDDGGDGTTEPPSSAPVEGITLPDGRVVTAQQAQEYLQFLDYLGQNPKVAQDIGTYLQGGYELRPVAPPPGQTDDTQFGMAPGTPDEEPPNQKLVEIEERLKAQEAVVASQMEASTKALITRAENDFAKAHKLTETEMKHISDVAARLQVLPAFMSQVDPITGQPRNVDPLVALSQAFDVAFNTIPEYREKSTKRIAESARQDRTKKRKLGSLGGASGSAPRSNPAPKSPDERRQAMIDEIAQAMSKE